MAVEQGDREKERAYEYLCRMEEAKKWLETVLSEPLPPAVALEDALQNGVLLCRLGMKVLPTDPMWKKVYDLDQLKYKSKGLDYRYTDNINFWLASLQKIGLPKVFYPVMTDVFHKKNMPKLIYCIHALSHLLKRQGQVSQAVDDLYGTAKFSQDVLQETSKVLKLKVLPAFGVVESLVEEELQYQAAGLSESFEEDLKTPTSPRKLPEFDDPQYMSREKLLAETASTAGSVNGETDPAPGTKPSASPFAVVPCSGQGIQASLYQQDSSAERVRTDSTARVEPALENINNAIERRDPTETMKALKNPDANLPLVYQDIDKYLAALQAERDQGLPCSLLAVFSGINRDTCDNLLESMNPGAYIVRESTTMPGIFVFSFRNQTGIKHWKLNVNDGRFFWGASSSFDTLDAFVQHFVKTLSQITKLHVYPGMANTLQPMFQTSEYKARITALRKANNTLSYGQICRVIKEVNSEIRKRRKSMATEGAQANPPSQEANTLWDSSMIHKVNRSDAATTLTKEGRPGSFLVRPSEWTPGDYALAFRTKKEIRHWKIVQENDNYFVYPRPHPYDSLDDVVQHFRDAVGVEIGLAMEPLVCSEPREKPEKLRPKSCGTLVKSVVNGAFETTVDRTKTLPVPKPRKMNLTTMDRSTSVPAAVPSASMSKLNPANLQSWSVNDVCQWLVEQGLGRFVEVFHENVVDGECLLMLDNTLLKEDLGITALGHRSRILKRVDVLKSQYSPPTNTK